MRTALSFAATLLLAAPLPAATPTDNPLAKYKLAWADALPWKTAVSLADFAGESADARLKAAQDALAAKGGGMLFVPAGTYTFKDHVLIRNGVVVRGADPVGETDARKEGYAPPTRFEFPKYTPKFEGDGTPTDAAFKGIALVDPSADSNCGLVNVAVERGHVAFLETPEHKVGTNRVVVGCVFRNAATAEAAIPDLKIGQHPWQRFTARHHAAITVRSGENALVANNRLPKSGDDNFTMKGYVLEGRKNAKVVCEEGVVFDYDNRPGLYVNDFGLGGAGGSLPDGTPETHPFGFRKGVVIRDNFVYCSGRCAISFSGDGTYCGGNVIRFPKKLWRPTATGRGATLGSSTNDNRAVQMRGWRWTVEGNDYEVYRNLAYDKVYEINDGEGLMHEDHVNSTVLDSKLLDNKGNSYLSIYKTGGINGLVVKGNDIRTPAGISAIYVVADRNPGRNQTNRFECKNVLIEGNTTAGSGIEVCGEPAANNVVRNNTHVGPGGMIVNKAAAELENNTGYELKR